MLGNVIDTGGMSYPQYVLPVVIIQVIFLGALTTVDRAARDERSDFGDRLRTLPISAVTPLMARMLYCLFRGALGLLAAIAVGYVFGFRMFGGFVYAAAFAVLVLMLTLALSLAADAAGVLSVASQGGIASSGALSQLLLVPQMLLVMLSTGMAPVDSFPDWLHPFVRNQPVSQVTQTLRGFAAGHVVVEQSGDQLGMVPWAAGGVRCDRGAGTEADAMTANAPPRSSLAAESLVFAGRLLTQWRRQPTMLIQSSGVPDLSADYLQTAGRQVDNEDHRHGQSLRLGADVRRGRCDVRGACSRPQHSYRPRQRSDRPTVGVSRAPGQRPDRSGCSPRPRARW